MGFPVNSGSVEASKDDTILIALANKMDSINKPLEIFRRVFGGTSVVSEYWEGAIFPMKVNKDGSKAICMKCVRRKVDNRGFKMACCKK